MSTLKVSVSGIRGIWGDSLTLQTLQEYTLAFAAYVKSYGGKSVLLGRDARPTGSLIAHYCTGILNALGMDVIDIGIVPTPTVLYGVRNLPTDAGIIVSASHNPVQWNALKFVKKGGLFTGEADLAKILAALGKEAAFCAPEAPGKYRMDESVEDSHIEAVLKNINVSAIKQKTFKVVLDPVNSAGSRIGEKLLEKLGCNLKIVNGEMNGSFGRGTEPTPANLTHLSPIVRQFKAAIGFAMDPDADRLVLIDETGTVLSEELTLAIALPAVLSKKKGDIAINLSTSQASEAVAESFGVKCHRTKVGEANVVEGIVAHNCIIGGEGNGGVIYPSINTARDSLVGIGLVLERMAETGKTLSQLAKEVPAFAGIKEKYNFSGDLNAVYSKIKAIFPGAEVNELDGLWLRPEAGTFLHIRPSNTEPVVRIIGEGRDEARLKAQIDSLRKILVG